MRHRLPTWPSRRRRTSPTTPAPRRVRVLETSATEVLPGWDYADAFEVELDPAHPVDATTVARALLTPSGSMRRVLAVRDLLVRSLGLRPAEGGDELLFPVFEHTSHRVVSGLDDRHLDFRVIVTVSPGAARCTTVVRRHGRLGRGYFAVVGPFHRRLVLRLMRRCREARVDAAVVP